MKMYKFQVTCGEDYLLTGYAKTEILAEQALEIGLLVLKNEGYIALENENGVEPELSSPDIVDFKESVADKLNNENAICLRLSIYDNYDRTLCLLYLPGDEEDAGVAIDVRDALLDDENFKNASLFSHSIKKWIFNE